MPLIRRLISANSFCALSLTILVSNEDDHLKNHGFLYVGAGRWRLSPGFRCEPRA
ncbi:HipA domain-containing protein [Rhizobium yanglingense]